MYCHQARDQNHHCTSHIYKLSDDLLVWEAVLVISGGCPVVIPMILSYLLLGATFRLRLEYVPSEQNIADLPSRRRWSEHFNTQGQTDCKTYYVHMT